MRGRTNRLTFRALNVALLIAAVFLWQGCDTESDDIPTGPAITIDQLIRQGWQYLNEGETDQALITFQEAANADASNLEAYLGLGYGFALSQEPISAMGNLGNVLSLGEVMLESGVIEDSSYVDSLFAEAYAGRASVAYSTQDYETAIAEARSTQEIWSSFANPRHRWLPDFTLDHVKLFEAEAWYGLGEYGEAMLIADELSGGAFIDQLVADGDLVRVVDEELEVTMLQETQTTGVAQLDLPNDNLVYPSSVSRGSIEFAIVDYDVTGDAVRFQANPIPSPGDTYMTSYYYAVDFGAFLILLRDQLDELQ